MIEPLESPALFKTPAISMVTILKEDNKIIIIIIIIRLMINTIDYPLPFWSVSERVNQ